MASIRDLNHKISSLQNMKKVMSAMNMIASTKFRKLLKQQIALQKFTASLEKIKSAIHLMISKTNSPLVVGHGEKRKVHIVIFTADRGLCASHNSSVFKRLEKLLAKLNLSSGDFDVTSIGQRGAKYCRKHEYNLFHSVDINEKTLRDSNILRISQNILTRYLAEEIGSVFVIYNHFVSALTQETTLKKMLPISIPEDIEEQKQHVGMTSDLSPAKLAESATPLLLFYQLKIILLNSYLSENGARMTAMENATHNSEDLINRYAKLKNKARQTAITNELTEIVAGKEAMK